MIAGLYRPDMYWLRRALLMAIWTHPLVINTKVPYPSVNGLTNEPVGISKGRLFGGPELIESGLTLAVFPYHSSYDSLEGDQGTSIVRGKSVTYHYPNLGQNSPGEANIKMVVQLYYRDAGYDVPTTLTADVLDPESNYRNDPYGYRFEYSDETQTTLSEESSELVNKISLPVQILPAEEILTQWLDLIKDVIRNIRVLKPYTNIRNPTILCADYPSTTWTSSDGNLIFHTAYLIVEFCAYEALLEPLVSLPTIEQIKATI
jgi:hypothetical protein